LTGADFQGARLDRVNLTGADLRDSSVDGANLSSVEMSGANCLDANLSRTAIDEAPAGSAHHFRSRGAGRTPQGNGIAEIIVQHKPWTASTAVKA